MKITIESTPELAHANGLPVRIWTGKTERGTPILALVTRIAAPDNAPADELAQLERELTEPPTRVVDPGREVIAAPRNCTVCLARNIRRPATHVATAGDGAQWYECGQHASNDNLMETLRLTLEPIEAWFERAELPMPPGQAEALQGGVYRGPASAREPWASILRDAPSFDQAGDSLREALHRAAEAKVAELASECRSLRERLKERDGASWLVKDFWALYCAAKRFSEACHGRGNEGPYAPQKDLDAQLGRLRPAFEVCESERRGRGDTDRLTTAERTALEGLHRWLHSPGGDWALVEAAEAFHEQIGTETSACDLLEAEEKAAFADLCRPSAPAAPPSAAPAADLHAIISGALARARKLSPQPDGAHRATPPIPAAFVSAVLGDAHVSGPGVGVEVGATFMMHAMRGAHMAWHAINGHPDQIALVANMHAPIDEPDRSAWLTGYRIVAPAALVAAEADPHESPTLPDVDAPELGGER